MVQLAILQLLLYSRTMKQKIAIKTFEALASPVRLDIYRLLVRYGTEGLVAGKISEALNIPPTNLSFHLKMLVQSNLITSEQEGRFQRFRSNIPLMLEVIAYLTQECCLHHPEECLIFREKSSVNPSLLPPKT